MSDRETLIEIETVLFFEGASGEYNALSTKEKPGRSEAGLVRDQV